jgi:UMP-CMP kinase
MMLSGSIVPSEVTCSLLEKAMAGYSAKGTNHFLIDGFPRNEENWKGWQKFIGNKANIQFVLSFVCPPDVCVARCLDRGKTSGRADDNAETLKKRLQQFETEGKPVIDDFRKKKLLKEIDACGSADEVFAAVSKLFAK